MRNEKRFITKIEDGNLIERITYEKWCNHLTVSSFFVTNEIIDQVKCFYPETLVS